MRCSKCGFDNPAGMKFCGQCTAALALVCPKCHSENPPGFKFCGQCTTALAPATAGPEPSKSPVTVREADEAGALEGERKTVTALFADIKGSTELEQDLDPEEARAIVDPALKLMIEAVRRYDGYVVQSTGDGIFAIFGAADRARGPSTARALCRTAHAGRIAPLLRAVDRRWRQSAAMPGRRQHRRGGRALDLNRR
jgi:class 3 adenylate cyclase